MPEDDQVLHSLRPEESKPGEEGNGGPNEQEHVGEKESMKSDSNASNILDDMEQFQKEIDALRSRYEKAT